MLVGWRCVDDVLRICCNCIDGSRLDFGRIQTTIDRQEQLEHVSQLRCLFPSSATRSNARFSVCEGAEIAVIHDPNHARDEDGHEACGVQVGPPPGPYGVVHVEVEGVHCQSLSFCGDGWSVCGKSVMCNLLRPTGPDGVTAVVGYIQSNHGSEIRPP